MRKVKPRFDIPKPIARKVDAPSVGRRARIGLDSVTPKKQFDTTGEIGRHHGSRPPPKRDGEPEYQVSHEAPRTKTTRALRLWSKTEIR